MADTKKFLSYTGLKYLISKLTGKIEATVKDSGYLPTSGGEVTGDLTVDGTTTLKGTTTAGAVTASGDVTVGSAGLVLQSSDGHIILPSGVELW